MKKIVYWDITEYYEALNEKGNSFVLKLSEKFCNNEVSFKNGFEMDGESIFVTGNILNGIDNIVVDFYLVLNGILGSIPDSFCQKFYNIFLQEIKPGNASFLSFSIENEKYNEFKEPIEKYLIELGGYVYDEEKDEWKHYKKGENKCY